MCYVAGVQAIVMLVSLFFASFAFEKSTLNSTFDVDVATNFSIWHWVKTAPLRWMGCLSYGVHPSKKCLDYWLRESIDNKYEAS